MSLNLRYMLLYLWITLLGYILVLNLILYLNQQQATFLSIYHRYGDSIYYQNHLYLKQSMYLVILLPIFVITPIFGKIILIIKNANTNRKTFSLFTLSKSLGIITFSILFIQSLLQPSLEPAQVLTVVGSPFFFVLTLYQFQNERTKR